MNSMGAVLTAISSGLSSDMTTTGYSPLSRQANATEVEDLADIVRRLAQEGDEAARLRLFDRICQHIGDSRRRIDRRVYGAG